MTCLETLNSAHSRRRYAAVYREFDRELTPAGVQAYIAERRDAGYAPATVNLHLAALKFRARAEEADPKIQEIKSMPIRGVRMGTWLSIEQVTELLAVPGAGLVAARNKAILAVLTGAALRRSELASLQCSHLQMLDGRQCINDIIGKGRRVRTVPLPAWCSGPLNAWLECSGVRTGPVWRRIYHEAVAEGGISADYMHEIVQEHGVRIGVPGLSPHDLRRTFARLSLKGKGDLEQISVALGHANIATTSKYIGRHLDLENPACDAIKL